MRGDVKVTCKRCGRSVNAEQFTLDPVYKMIVCPFCVQERKFKKDTKGEDHLAQPIPAGIKVTGAKGSSKPGDWDNEDDYLEKLYRRRKEEMGNIQKIDDSRIKYTCAKCKFKFSYNL